MKRRLKVLLLHGEAAPYRLALFESLNQEVDLEVYECQHGRVGRMWSIPSRGHSFKRRCLEFLRIGPFTINYTLSFSLIFRRYDVYILGDYHRVLFSTLIAFSLAKLFGKALVMWSSSINDNYVERYKRMIDEYILRPIFNFFYLHSDALTAYGEATKRHLIKTGVNPQNIFTGTQVVCITKLVGDIHYACAMRGHPSFKGKKVILSVCYFERRKGLDYMIDAYKSLNRDDAILVLAGAGKEEARLKELAKAKSDSIYFPGYVEGEEKAYYYSIADIFVLPTLCDEWGLVINEAMAFGLPIITTEHAGCAEELVKGNGFIVEARSALALKEAMERLLNDEDLRRKMAEESKKLIEGYTIEKARKTFMDAIAQAVRSRAIRN